METQPPYRTVLHQHSLDALERYRAALVAGRERPGARLANVMATSPTSLDDAASLLEALFATKQPQIFAESQVHGDGRDWTPRELDLLGDAGVAVDVLVYDDGRHRSPAVHETPFAATLLFVPGLLLRCDRGGSPADWHKVVVDGAIDDDAFARAYERRLLPLLRHADTVAAARGCRGVVTMPGLGCGQFAGPFRGELGARLAAALRTILGRHAAALPHLAAIYFDPYDEGDNTRCDFGPLSLRVRPLQRGNVDKPQLCRPSRYAEAGDDFADCHLVSFVAWDHVSWPGNDFYGGARATDDGVKAAATNAIAVLTGVEGRYDRARTAYLPPAPYATWGDLVRQRGLRLAVRDRLLVL